MAWPESPIPNDIWVVMPQYGGMQYMYSPPSAHNVDDDGRLKLRLGNYQARRRIPEEILEAGHLAEVVWDHCYSFYQRLQYDVAHGRRSGYGE